jgi:hypothetical protein
MVNLTGAARLRLLGLGHFGKVPLKRPPIIVYAGPESIGVDTQQDFS